MLENQAVAAAIWNIGHELKSVQYKLQEEVIIEGFLHSYHIILRKVIIVLHELENHNQKNHCK